MNKAVLSLCLVLIAAAVGGGVWYYFNEMDGVFPGGRSKKDAKAPKQVQEFVKPTPSPLVSHEKMATPTTVARAVVEPRRIAALLHKLIPWDEVEKAPISSGVKKMLKDNLEEMLPNEIAVLGGPNYESKLFDVTLFANQQQFDVLIPLAGNRILPEIPFVTWTSGLKLHEPGALAAAGTLPLPEGLDAKLQENGASLAAPANPLKAEGGHLFEIVLDNRNAALLALVSAGAALNGLVVEQVFAMPYMDQVTKVLSQLSDLRAQADVGPAGELIVDIKLGKAEGAGPEIDMPVSFVVTSFVLPEIESRLAKEGLSMEGKAEWEGSVYHARYTVANAEATVLELIQSLLKGDRQDEARPDAAAAAGAAPAAAAQPQP